MRRLYWYDAGFGVFLVHLGFFSIFFLDKSRKLSKIVSVLQSASVERFDVSRMRDFFYDSIYNFNFEYLLVSEKSEATQIQLADLTNMLAKNTLIR